MKIKRKIYEKIAAHLCEKEITIITGARQVGKTTLLKQLIKDLEKKGEKTLFFNLDILSHKRYFESQETFVQKLQLEAGKEPVFVFIDEIQRLENAGLFLKGLYDMELPCKFIVSGSGSLELKEKIHESLTGRKRMFEVQPVSYEEMVEYRTGYAYEGRWQDFFELEREKTYSWLLEYLNYGGYPRIVLESVANKKRALLDEIFHSYLERDITVLLSLSRPDAFVLMIRLLADKIGNPLNFSQLSTQTGLALATLKKYLWYAEKTFIIKKVLPFFRNTRKELTRSPEIYFVDTGLRNYALNLAGRLEPPVNMRMIFENFVFNILFEKALANNWTIKYWRSKDKAEIDFIIDMGYEQIPVEVKFQDLRKTTISRSFHSFLKKYQPARALIVNLSLETSIYAGETKVSFIPFYRLFAEETFQ